jgi:hypothetical protein
MKISTKVLLYILVIGFLYSIYSLFNGEGGSGLGDFSDGLVYTSLLLFFVSLLIVFINIKNLKQQGAAFLFMLIGFPMTLQAIIGVIKFSKVNRAPNLTAKYARPVNQQTFIDDSLHIVTQIDSLIALRNRNTGGIKVASAIIDTIFYSEKGDQIFISYVEKFEPNNLGNDLSPSYLSADSRDSNFWHLKEGPPNANYLGGSYHDINELKEAVRKFYFNRYSFLDRDSLKENYFWK